MEEGGGAKLLKVPFLVEQTTFEFSCFYYNERVLDNTCVYPDFKFI